MAYKSKKLKGGKKRTRKNYNSKRGGSNSRKSNKQFLKVAESFASSVASSALEKGKSLYKSSTNTLFKSKGKASSKSDAGPGYEPEISSLVEASVAPTSIPYDSKTFLPLDGFKEKLIPLLQTKNATHPSASGDALVCKIYLIKVKTGKKTFDYYIYDSESKKYWEDTQVYSELHKLEDQIRSKDGSERRCRGIGKDWIELEYESNDISIFLFSLPSFDLI